MNQTFVCFVIMVVIVIVIVIVFLFLIVVVRDFVTHPRASDG